MTNTTYAQLRANAHRVGGTTQTEACQRMRDADLRRRSLGFLRGVLEDLDKEARVCTSMHDYAAIREQVLRFRAAIAKKAA